MNDYAEEEQLIGSGAVVTFAQDCTVTRIVCGHKSDHVAGERWAARLCPECGKPTSQVTLAPADKATRALQAE